MLIYLPPERLHNMGERAITLVHDQPLTSRQETRRSLDDLFREHHESVYLAAYRVTGSVQDAEDVLQSVFLKLLKRIGDGNFAENPAGYLCRAAINASLDLLRSARRVQTVNLETEIPPADLSALPVESDVESAEQRRNLRIALSSLNSRAAEIFALRYFEDYGNAEIAEMLDTSSSSVAVTLHRTRDRLQAHLRELAGENQ